MVIIFSSAKCRIKIQIALRLSMGNVSSGKRDFVCVQKYIVECIAHSGFPVEDQDVLGPYRLSLSGGKALCYCLSILPPFSPLLQALLQIKPVFFVFQITSLVTIHTTS